MQMSRLGNAAAIIHTLSVFFLYLKKNKSGQNKGIILLVLDRHTSRSTPSPQELAHG